ncbi:unnamed protein product [Lepidochelys kempii]
MQPCAGMQQSWAHSFVWLDCKLFGTETVFHQGFVQCLARQSLISDKAARCYYRINKTASRKEVGLEPFCSPPLTDLTKKKQPNAVQWTEECQKAFNQLKATLTSDPVLRAPDFDKLFLVTTDASKRDVGAVLIQEGLNQEFHPVVFLSKKLSERESNWSISEKECYAIVYALEKLHPYVWGQHFYLQTDHAALQWLHTTTGNNKKLLWWSLALQDFDFDIQHISGASNKVADAPSCESFPESAGPNCL